MKEMRSSVLIQKVPIIKHLGIRLLDRRNAFHPGERREEAGIKNSFTRSNLVETCIQIVNMRPQNLVYPTTE